MNPEVNLNIGTIVVTTVDLPGIEYQGSKYGFVAKNMVGVVVGFTEDDGRAMVAFNREIHTSIEKWIRVLDKNDCFMGELMELSANIYGAYDIPF